MNRCWIVLAAVLVGTCSSARADIIYNITMNTSPLIGHAAGPFSLEFQFNDGEGIGDGNNTVLLSSFLFGSGGSAAGSPSTTGNVTGDLGSSVQFTDTVFFNQFIQPFSPGAVLSFVLKSSTNVDASGTPDQFTFSILDSSGSELPSTSFASSFFDVFMQIDIDSPNPVVQTFASDTSRLPAAGGSAIDMAAPSATPAASTVPEPSTLVLLATALGAIGFAVGRRRDSLH